MKFCSSFWLVSSIHLATAAEGEIPIEYQFSAGVRSNYVYRGHSLADDTQDFIVRADIDFQDTSTFSSKMWTHIGIDSDFDEIGASLEYTKTLGSLTYIFGASYKDSDNFIDDFGAEFSAGGSYAIHPEWYLQGGVYYDFGLDGWYMDTEIVWLKELSQRSYTTLKLGISFANDYLQVDGFNDLYGSASYTYDLSDQVSLNSYLNLSSGARSSGEATVGFWFEASF